MAADPKPYVVRRGDYLSAIAFRAGTTVDALLALAKNADLKERHPEILAPGDVVYLPPPPEASLDVALESSNSFAAEVPLVDVHVTLKGRDGKPLKAQEMLPTPVLSPEPIKCDGEGKVALTAPIHVGFIRLVAAETGETFDVRIGHLDPHADRSGLLSRLRQLGYVGDEEHRLVGRPWLGDDGEDMAARTLAQAVAAFQEAKGQKVTGVADEALCTAVRDEHGS